MTTTAFDTLGYFEKLKAAGVPETQAKAHADTLRELIDSRVVTREYLDIKLAELEYRLENRLTIRFGAMIAAAVAILAALIAILR